MIGRRFGSFCPAPFAPLSLVRKIIPTKFARGWECRQGFPRADLTREGAAAGVCAANILSGHRCEDVEDIVNEEVVDEVDKENKSSSIAHNQPA